MYGYRHQPGADINNSMPNNHTNSISSSLSSIDTTGRRAQPNINHDNTNNCANANANNTRASNDNLITLRSPSNNSTSLLWRNSNNNKEFDRYSTATSVRNGSRCPGSEIYYNGGSRLARTKVTNCCPASETALDFLLVPLLLLTILRQVFDFLGQIWLQILVNFFTILIVIIALFGIKQARISYLLTFILWSLFNSFWNFFVVCIHTKLVDVRYTEDFLSLYTGTTSWWHTYGPGCLPYNISSIQPPMTTIKSNIITGCRLDYHLVEATQAALHACLSFFASFTCFFVILAIRRNPNYFIRKQPKSDKSYRLNNLTSNCTKINHDPYPNQNGTRFRAGSTSLRRASNKVSSRGSQHSVSSLRSRRRNRQSIDGTLPTPRGSNSSAQRYQKYGSLSSRRSHRKDRRGDVSSLTYGTTAERVGANQRSRLSSMTIADYLPSYQPPHSSNANLLSSYGEISSIDSYTNNRGSGVRASKYKMTNGGNTNHTYVGSRSSVCSQNANGAHNYDDLSYIYGNNSRASESVYGASTSAGLDQSRYQRQRQYQQIYHQDEIDGPAHNSRNQQKMSRAQEMSVESLKNSKSNSQSNGDSTLIKSKIPLTNGSSFQTFTVPKQQSNPPKPVQKESPEINNNHVDSFDVSNEHNNATKTRTFEPRQAGPNTFDNRSRIATNNVAGDSLSQQQLYSNQNSSRHPVYTNQMANGNSETPI